MAWLKAGDTAAMDERVLGVAELADADERSVNEVFGFVARLFLQAAQQGSDYRVAMGTAMVLSPRYQLLLEQAAMSGLLAVAVEDGRKVIRLVADGEFFHIRTRQEQDWETARKADVGTMELIIPVRLRDGDACRYCGNVVAFGDQKGNRGGTYDHIVPGKRAENIDGLVVACRGCNGGRRDAEGARNDRYPLLPPPAEGGRYFSTSTIEWLEKHGTIVTQLGLQIPKRPRGAKNRPAGSQTRGDVRRLLAQSGDAETAATASSGEQRPAPSQTRPADAAPPTSGDQRAGSAREDSHDLGNGAPAAPASATPATSGRTRADQNQVAPESEHDPVLVVSQVEQNPPRTSENAEVQSDPDVEAERSGSAGSGRDGTGRAGKGREGPGRDGSPPPSGGSAEGRRRKRGRRRRGKR